jgi:DMSO/TMAO reductase YedYZ heme-binding membrane subunit
LVHNRTAVAALAVSAIHPVILLFSRSAGFHWLDVVFPAWAPRQPVINLLGAAALYCVVIVVVASQFRLEMGRKTWKALHYTTYVVAGFGFVHSLLTDSQLNGTPFDPLDGEKLFVEGCLLVVVLASLARARYALQKPRIRRGVLLSAEN